MCINFSFLSSVFEGFEKFFPKTEENGGVNKSAQSNDGSWGHSEPPTLSLSSVPCLCLLQCFSFCTLDINTKEQDSFVRKEQDGNDRNGDDGRGGERGGGKKEEWQWWTRLQVWLSLVFTWTESSFFYIVFILKQWWKHQEKLPLDYLMIWSVTNASNTNSSTLISK